MNVELNHIYNEDCLKTLQRMEDNSIDLICTSPPYNKGAHAKASDGKLWNAIIDYDSYDDSMPQDDYEEWQKTIIKECLRVLRPSGSLFYNHKDLIEDGHIIHPKWMYDFNVHQLIIWNRLATPNVGNRYFLPTTEYVYLVIKDAKKFKFNRNNACFNSCVWNLTAELNTKHPAPFPLKLVDNMICACTDEGDVVYDPFMGSGTTALACVKYKRNYIGSEISSTYVKMAQDRINEENMTLSLF